MTVAVGLGSWLLDEPCDGRDPRPARCDAGPALRSAGADRKSEQTPEALLAKRLARARSTSMSMGAAPRRSRTPQLRRGEVIGFVRVCVEIRESARRRQRAQGVVVVQPARRACGRARAGTRRTGACRSAWPSCRVSRADGHERRRHPDARKSPGRLPLGAPPRRKASGSSAAEAPPCRGSARPPADVAPGRPAAAVELTVGLVLIAASLTFALLSATRVLADQGSGAGAGQPWTSVPWT